MRLLRPDERSSLRRPGALLKRCLRAARGRRRVRGRLDRVDAT
jgi:hypothetical protein